MSAYQQAFEQFRRHFDVDFERHEMHVDAEGPKVFALTLRRPGTWAYGVEILCTPVGIVMHGDFTPPSSRGPCGAYMKDLAWFAAEMGADYMASKFLEKTWTREGAEDHVRDNIEALRQEVTYLNTTERKGGQYNSRDAMLARCTELDAMLASREGLADLDEYIDVWAPEWEEDGRDSEWCFPNNAYDPAGMAALAAIHGCFRRLFWARYESIERIDGGYRLKAKVPT